MSGDDFFTQLLEAFRVEAEEHLCTISSGLVELERAPAAAEQQPIVETIFRAAHSLKGAARAVNMLEVEKICQSAEHIFSVAKKAQVTLPAELFDTLYQAVDMIRAQLTAPEGVDPARMHTLLNDMNRLRALVQPSSDNVPFPAAHISSNASDTSESVDASVEGDNAIPPQVREDTTPTTDSPVPAEQGCVNAAATPQPEKPMDESKVNHRATIRVAADRLDTVLLQAEEMLASKLTIGQRAVDLQDLCARLRQLEKSSVNLNSEMRQACQPSGARTKHVDQEALHARLLEFLDWHHHFLTDCTNDLDLLLRSTESDSRTLGGMVDNLLLETKKLLLLPCSTILQTFPRMVRDLAHELGREVDLIMEGTEVELDKRVLEKLKDPLTHIIRNSIDHGIEPPDTRERQGKPPRGTIRIMISQVDSNKVEVVIADDGSGIDLERVRKAAIAYNLVTEEGAERLDSEALTAMIFQSGISTSKLITDISGRGLGMAIVREHIEELGGLISVETVRQHGTTMRILLPVTHTTFRGIFVQVAGQIFVVPMSYVGRVWRLKRDEIKTVENRETIALNGKAIALVHLADILGMPAQQAQEDPFIQVLVLGIGELQIAFCVDGVLHEQEVLVKRLGKQLARVRNIAGATVLGSGQVVTILNVRDLLESAVKGNAGRAVHPAKKTDERKQQSLLIVEDSVTSRMLLKNILESAGYLVKVAVDGVEGLTLLKSEAFDLVVSDVEMPRMDGFMLTEQIRNDKALQDLPVVLVTSLEAREHRERGVDVGANAYIVKSSFDQSNLLETIHRLI